MNTTEIFYQEIIEKTSQLEELNFGSTFLHLFNEGELIPFSPLNKSNYNLLELKNKLKESGFILNKVPKTNTDILYYKLIWNLKLKKNKLVIGPNIEEKYLKEHILTEAVEIT
jgi:hypothetical protein